MDQAEFQRRTMEVGVAVLSICDMLPRKVGAEVIARQLARSATSVGANYRASCRAKSLRDILYKLGVVEEEADETLFWLDMLVEGGYIEDSRVEHVRDEASQILAMTVASRRTLRARLSNGPESPNRRIEELANRQSHG